MREWILSTVLPVYKLIERGGKTYDTRAPDPFNPQKSLHKAEIRDTVLIMPTKLSTFEPILDLPPLKYEISDIQYFKPQNEDWKSIVEKTLDAVGLEKVFPGYSLEQALAMYLSFPNYPKRIKEHGIVAIGFGKRLD